MNRKIIYWLLAMLLVMVLILGGIIWYQKNNQDLKVIFLDVGQGDAILVQQGGNQLLIDGGRSGKVLLEKLGSFIPFWDRQIEAVVATHPDQDHIGGLVEVLKSYKVPAVIKTKAESESQTYKALVDEIKKEGAEIVEARKGLGLNFLAGARAEVIFPAISLAAGVATDSNAGSVVVKMDFGENSFLLTGDLPSKQEQELLSNNVDIISNILKVAHHGSKYSTSVEFLDAVKPEEAVFSVGKNNSYGHPNQEILSRLAKRGIKIWRTDEMGDIIYKCNLEHSGQDEKCEMTSY